MTIAPSLINGLPASEVSLQDRGLAYADGLFETIVVRDNEVLRWRYHWQRLIQGCQVLGLPQPDEKQVVDELTSCDHPHYIAKLILTRGGGGRGYLPDPEAQPNRMVQFFQPPEHDADPRQYGIETAILKFKLGNQPELAGIKHLGRLEQVLARAEADQLGLSEGLVLDQQGFVVEGCQSNVVLMRDHQLYTPCLDRCGIQGVFLSWLADSYAIEPIRIGVNELSQFDALFFCNSVRGIVPVRQIREVGEYNVAAVIELSQQLSTIDDA